VKGEKSEIEDAVPARWHVGLPQPKVSAEMIPSCKGKQAGRKINLETDSLNLEMGFHFYQLMQQDATPCNNNRLHQSQSLFSGVKVSSIPSLVMMSICSPSPTSICLSVALVNASLTSPTTVSLGKLSTGL